MYQLWQGNPLILFWNGLSPYFRTDTEGKGLGTIFFFFFLTLATCEAQQNELFTNVTQIMTARDVLCANGNTFAVMERLTTSWNTQQVVTDFVGMSTMLHVLYKIQNEDTWLPSSALKLPLEISKRNHYAFFFLFYSVLISYFPESRKVLVLCRSS